MSARDTIFGATVLAKTAAPKLGMLGCIVKLPDEVCVNHTKRVGENKAVLHL